MKGLPFLECLSGFYPELLAVIFLEFGVPYYFGEMPFFGNTALTKVHGNYFDCADIIFYIKTIFFFKFEKWTIILNLGLDYIQENCIYVQSTHWYDFSPQLLTKVDGSLFEDREQC